MARKKVRLCLLAAIGLTFLGVLLRHVNDPKRLHHVRHDDNLNLLHRNSSRRLSTPQQQQPQLLHSSEGYTYLIIHYHKSGHILTQNLRDILLQIDPSTQRNYIDRFPRRQHDPHTKCPHLTLHPNTIYVQSSPDFFCDVNVLAEELLSRPTKQRGVKLIHLVRNPFKMAISNYKYHSQDPLPEGENWMKRTNPCAVIDKSAAVYAQLVMKTLTTTPGAYRLMEYDDFPIIQSMCHRLYNNNNQQFFHGPGFYMHLLNLPPTEGLILATTYLLLGHGGDILRMANNIIKLRQLQLLEQKIIHLRQHSSLRQFRKSEESKKRKVQVLTMSMDHFILHPKAATIQFLDYISSKDDDHDGGVRLSSQEKEEIATRYEQMYYEKVTAGDEHITSLLSKNSDEEDSTVVMSESSMKLETSLRENVIFGRILGNIENLVEESLRGVHNWY
eukprot:CAMPEP_0201693594 /NCGR_PEP_ID=MMETSP0578-20130828/6139_1 /ASSEMBLY_ACC=CAM_ASM_000663 /TAXON_ID=267565 /ORGANISM="Skeletonema grethea, Strain CCMP 1804" /LENGTH=443 /DNA_ID=CAMNT_0048179157 /DNA_START=15 /DNA_END=1346 /DNA_ORIENTATION=-